MLNKTLKGDDKILQLDLYKDFHLENMQKQTLGILAMFGVWFLLSLRNLQGSRTTENLYPEKKPEKDICMYHIAHIVVVPRSELLDEQLKLFQENS